MKSTLTHDQVQAFREEIHIARLNLDEIEWRLTAAKNSLDKAEKDKDVSPAVYSQAQAAYDKELSLYREELQTIKDMRARLPELDERLSVQFDPKRTRQADVPVGGFHPARKRESNVIMDANR